MIEEIIKYKLLKLIYVISHSNYIKKEEDEENQEEEV